MYKYVINNDKIFPNGHALALSLSLSTTSTNSVCDIITALWNYDLRGHSIMTPYLDQFTTYSVGSICILNTGRASTVTINIYTYQMVSLNGYSYL